MGGGGGLAASLLVGCAAADPACPPCSLRRRSASRTQKLVAPSSSPPLLAPPSSLSLSLLPRCCCCSFCCCLCCSAVALAAAASCRRRASGILSQKNDLSFLPGVGAGPGSARARAAAPGGGGGGGGGGRGRRSSRSSRPGDPAALGLAGQPPDLAVQLVELGLDAGHRELRVGAGHSEDRGGASQSFGRGAAEDGDGVSPRKTPKLAARFLAPRLQLLWMQLVKDRSDLAHACAARSETCAGPEAEAGSKCPIAVAPETRRSRDPSRRGLSEVVGGVEASTTPLSSSGARPVASSFQSQALAHEYRQNTASEAIPRGQRARTQRAPQPRASVPSPSS